MSVSVLITAAGISLGATVLESILCSTGKMDDAIWIKVMAKGIIIVSAATIIAKAFKSIAAFAL